MLGASEMKVQPIFVTIPHSGEKIPPQAQWLHGLDEKTLMYDVDRFVDVLYRPALEKLKLPYVTTEWHRYAADLNRVPTDIDSDSVVGAPHQSGKFSRGFHWVITTHLYRLMSQPISSEVHQELVELIYNPFHTDVKNQYENFRKLGYQKIYHIDAHSMPSRGTSEHRDPGQYRADVVVSDCHGKSCDAAFKDLVIGAYEQAGFSVAYNWPYFGGRLTEQYGQPDLGQQVLQVELNRGLYMDEVTKKLKDEKLLQIQAQLDNALTKILAGLPG
jgi:N-formylglutamate deformylase